MKCPYCGSFLTSFLYMADCPPDDGDEIADLWECQDCCKVFDGDVPMCYRPNNFVSVAHPHPLLPPESGREKDDSDTNSR